MTMTNYIRVNEPIVLTKLVMVTLKETKIEGTSWWSVNQGSLIFKRIQKNSKKY